MYLCNVSKTSCYLGQGSSGFNDMCAVKVLCHIRGLNACVGAPDLPEKVTEDMLHDDEFLRSFHHALLEIVLQEGALVCPETGRKFVVQKGIPNLLLNEDEV